MGVSMFGHIGPQAIVHATMVWYIFDVIWFIDLKLKQLIYWCIDHWLIDWLIGWLIGWLIDLLTDWLVDWLVDWLIGRFIINILNVYISIMNYFIKNDRSVESQMK